VKVTFTTAPVPAPNNVYSPSNVVAVWVQGPGGAFIKTVGQWVAVRQPNLVAWRAAVGAVNEVDVVSNASRISHAQPLTVLWNLRDRQGNVVPDGTYTIRLELAEANSTTAAQNNQGTFTFIKGPAPQTQNNLANGNFTNVSIAFDPNAVACNDGFVDAPDEKCDRGIAEGAGACPTTCPAADACMPVQLQGDSLQCSAECVAGAPITACLDGDGCCAAGCSEADDSDCSPGGGGGGGAPEASGGCETGSGSGGAIAFGALGLALLIRRRRR
jgi:uncharacterized protein (TIGR03382 family)